MFKLKLEGFGKGIAISVRSADVVENAKTVFHQQLPKSYQNSVESLRAFKSFSIAFFKNLESFLELKVLFC